MFLSFAIRLHTWHQQSCISHRLRYLSLVACTAHTRTHLFEAGRHAPAAGLHDAVVAAHVLAHLPVLLAPLLPASHDGRVAEERRDTVTGQSAGRGQEEEEEEEGETKRSVSGPSQPAAGEREGGAM